MKVIDRVPAPLASIATAHVPGRGNRTFLEGIIVTARKVSENLQETPIAIMALSAKSLENRPVFRNGMLGRIVPGQ
jgi:hypothetical protein